MCGREIHFPIIRQELPGEFGGKFGTYGFGYAGLITGLIGSEYGLREIQFG